MTVRSTTCLLVAFFFSACSPLVQAQNWSGPDPDAVSLPEPTRKVKLKPELLGKHPRLYFTASELEKLRAKVKDSQIAPMLQDLLATATTIAQATPPSGPPFQMDSRTLGDRLPRLAFAYLMTGDKLYLDGAKKWINAVVRYPNTGMDYDLAGAHVCFGLALAYDWLYDSLTTEERQGIEKKLLRHGRILLKISDPMKTGGGWPWGWAYFQNHFVINYTGVSAAALALYDLNPAEMQSWLDHTRSLLEVTFNHLGIDGGYPEGAAYADYGTTWMLYYADLLRSATGENLMNTPYLQKADRYFIDHVMPNGRDAVNFSDCPPQLFTHFSGELLLKLAAEHRNGRLLTLLDRVEEQNPVHWKAKYESPFCILWADPTLKPQPLDGLPLTGIYPDLGLVIFRTSWKEDAAVVAFRCGAPSGQHIATNWAMFKNANPSAGHCHPDANSFLFWADRRWQIGDPGAYTHDKVTHNENVWMVGGKGQRGGGIWFEDGRSYMGQAEQPHLVLVSDTPQASYVVGQAAPAYEEECGLTSFERRLLFVKGSKPYVIVFDQLKASKPQTWTAYFHAYEAFLSPQPGNPRVFEVSNGTPTRGYFSSSTKVTATHQALTVVGDLSNKPEHRGFELAVTPEGTTATTSLITVLATTSVWPRFRGTPDEPEIEIGNDWVSWDVRGQVTLNGKLIEGNLLPAPAKKD